MNEVNLSPTCPWFPAQFAGIVQKEMRAVGGGQGEAVVMGGVTGGVTGGRVRRIAAVVAAAGVGAVLVAGTARADDGGRPFRLEMSGAQEFNGAGLPSNVHGDADRGSIELRLNPGQEEVCFTVGELTLTAGEPLPTAGHIHVAPAGIAGPIVVHLFDASTAPASYPTGTSCVPAPRALILDILHDPSAYYVNLHNPPPFHPGGVVRAQLG
jgi:hypothetical protein